MDGAQPGSADSTEFVLKSPAVDSPLELPSPGESPVSPGSKHLSVNQGSTVPDWLRAVSDNIFSPFQHSALLCPVIDTTMPNTPVC